MIAKKISCSMGIQSSGKKIKIRREGGGYMEKEEEGKDFILPNEECLGPGGGGRDQS